MKTYISHKVVQAAKITAAEKEQDGRWHLVFENSVPVKIPAEDADRFKMTEEDLGYMVVYEGGYTSWSPSKAFEEGYTDVTATENGINWDSKLDFGMALAFLKEGERVAREGWNGKNMWIALTPGSIFDARHAKPGHAAKHRAEELQGDLPHDGTENVIELLPHIDMRAADGSMVIGWLASQTDMLAEDWMVVGGEG